MHGDGGGAHRVPDDHGGEGIVVAEVEADLHAGVTAADDEDALAAVGLAGLVLGDVGDGPGEFLGAVELGDDALGVLARGDDEPAADVLGGGVPGRGVLGAHPPQPRRGVVARGRDGLVEARLDAGARRVGLEVVDELALGGVLRVVVREGHPRELAEVARQVEAQAVVGAALPQGGDAVGAVQHHRRHPARPQARRHRQPRRPRAHHDRPVHPHHPARRRCHS
jgi:hypothetical protein